VIFDHIATQLAGWVERIDARQLPVCEDDGFREGLNPSYAFQSEGKSLAWFERENFGAARTFLSAQ